MRSLIFKEHHWIWLVNAGMDLASLQLALFLANLLIACCYPIQPTSNNYTLIHSLCLSLFPVGYWLQRLYPGYGLTAVERLRRRSKITLLLFLPLWAVDSRLFGHSPHLAALFTLLFFVLIIPSIAQYWLKNALVRLNCWGTPVLILGAGEIGARLVSTLHQDRVLGLQPIAMLDDDASKIGKDCNGVPIIAALNGAQQFVGQVRYVILAIPRANSEVQVNLAKTLPFPNVLIVPDLIGLQSLWVAVRDFNGVLCLELQKNLLIRRNRLFKSIMDYVAGSFIFIFSLPFLFVSALLVMAVNFGNPFYCQVREGLYGKRFKVWKLRTMFLNAEQMLHEYLANDPAAYAEWHQFFKLKHDPRILPFIGKFLRKTSLDELPQIWNVLRGEMSLVGPRPFPHYHLEEFSDDFRVLRRSVIPGMTGLWQVSARSDANLKVQEALDTYYIRNWSIWLDISLLIKTVQVVFSGKGAY